MRYSLFIKGHRSRVKNYAALILAHSPKTFCKCGCGTVLRRRKMEYTQGHNPASHVMSEKRKERISKSVKKAFCSGVLVPMVGRRNPASRLSVRRKMSSSARARCGHLAPRLGIKGRFLSRRLHRFIPYRSLMERRFLVWLETRCKANFLYEGLAIPYRYRGKTRTHFPDFVILYKKAPWKVVEVKPRFIATNPKGAERKKLEVAYAFCQRYRLRYELVTEDWLERRAA